MLTWRPKGQSTEAHDFVGTLAGGAAGTVEVEAEAGLSSARRVAGSTLGE